MGGFTYCPSSPSKETEPRGAAGPSAGLTALLLSGSRSQVPALLLILPGGHSCMAREVWQDMLLPADRVILTHFPQASHTSLHTDLTPKLDSLPSCSFQQRVILTARSVLTTSRTETLCANLSHRTVGGGGKDTGPGWVGRETRRHQPPAPPHHTAREAVLVPGPTGSSTSFPLRA